MNRPLRIFVGQLCDEASNNAQVLNAKALLSRFSGTAALWHIPFYNEPSHRLLERSNITLLKLWRSRLWKLHKFLLYQTKVDAIFYPNAYWFDDLALQLRIFSCRRVKVISTLEGLVGNEERERQLSEWAGHAVYCQHIPDSLLRRVDRVHAEADHIVAISPFLAKIGRYLYGDKFSVIPLAVDLNIFNTVGEKSSHRFKILGVGSLQKRKRPELFLDLAQRFPLADFVWFGEGELKAYLLNEIKKRNLANIVFPGSVNNRLLAEEFRAANLFILPSNSEGVPKVTQEAAACGLPIIIYGFYEAPTVADCHNGYVVWNDDELFERVGELIQYPDKARKMGEAGAKMALKWDWDKIAPQWESKILQCIS